MKFWPNRLLAALAACLAGLAGCATAPSTAPEWTVLELDQVKRIAEIRKSLAELRVDFRDVIIVRLTTGGEKRVDVTSIGPTIVGAEKYGAPAARTTFAMTPKRENLVLFTQDVPQRKAFVREIPLGELTAGKSFRFPVVQESGEVLEQTFTVQQVIVR